MEEIAPGITRWPDGRFYLYWAGDELLLNAQSAEEAIEEGRLLQQELNGG